MNSNRLLYGIVFLLFFTTILFTFKDLFNSYFEADEWFHFTRYIPLATNDNGLFELITKNESRIESLSDGQHVTPIAEAIFFFNTKLFGLDYKPYIFTAIFFHILNSFFVFILIIELFNSYKDKTIKYIFGLIGGLFFAFSATHIHTISWAAFYGLNIVSVTTILLSIIFLLKGIRYSSYKYYFVSSFCFLLSLLIKETSVILFLVVPLVVLLENRRNFFKIILTFIIPFIIYLPFRSYYLLSTWLNNANYDSPLYVSSINYQLLLFRLVVFPLNMISEVFFQRQVILTFVQMITPIIIPFYQNEDVTRSTMRVQFVYGPINDFILYILSFVILGIIIFLMKKYIRNKNYIFAKALFIGIMIICISALPLVINAIALPWWGFEFFDSRHYYLPSIGGAIVFSIFIVEFSRWISTHVYKLKKLSYVYPLIFLFGLWFFIQYFIISDTLKVWATTGQVRREIIYQIRKELPELNQSTVFYIETDPTLEDNIQQPSLPFQTNFVQMIAVLYYKENPWPNSYDIDYFIKTGEGYLMQDGYGLGYFRTKETLSEELKANKFKVSDIYAFSYDYRTNKIINISNEIRQELIINIED